MDTNEAAALALAFLVTLIVVGAIIAVARAITDWKYPRR